MFTLQLKRILMMMIMLRKVLIISLNVCESVAIVTIETDQVTTHNNIDDDDVIITRTITTHTICHLLNLKMNLVAKSISFLKLLDFCDILY